MADDPRRIKDLTDEQGSYDGEMWIPLDKEGLTTAKKAKLKNIFPEIVEVEIGSWNMQSTLYKNVAIPPEVISRIICIIGVSIIDDTAQRNVHFGGGIYDSTFFNTYSQFKSSVKEIQSETKDLTVDGLLYEGSSFYIQTGGPQIPSSEVYSNIDAHLHTINIPQLDVSDGFQGRSVTVSAWTDKLNNRIKLMHNNSKNSFIEVGEGTGTITNLGQMANFTSLINNRGSIILMLSPA